MMGHAYSDLFGIPMTGLRFFTVYGPWGALIWPISALLNDPTGQAITLFGDGELCVILLMSPTSLNHWFA